MQSASSEAWRESFTPLWRHLLAMLLILFVLLPSLAFGQAQISGTLTGIVSDSSGAVVPNAKVVLKNERTGDLRETKSNNGGYFAFAAVPPSVYTVSIEVTGFATWEQTGLTMNPGDKRNLDATVKVGTTQSEIQVVALADQLTPVDSGEKSTMLTAKDIKNLTVVGRNAAELIKVIPGMAVAGGLQNKPGYQGDVAGINGPLRGYSANGTEPTALQMTSDGANMTDPGCNCNASQNINTEMVQEIKVQTSNFSAENAKGPVIFNAVGKAGSSSFHGSSYMYARHYALNSNDYDTGTTLKLKKPEDRYFYPGGQIGGPVIIPHTGFNKNRDKLFFFAAFEYYDQNVIGSTKKSWVPTQQMLNGDFSQDALKAAFGPTPPYGVVNSPTGTPSSLDSFANGQIPKTMMDAGGVALSKALPAPNADPTKNGGFNWVTQYVLPRTSWQFRGRGDWSINQNMKFSVSYNLQREDVQEPTDIYWSPDWAVPYGSGVINKQKSQAVTGNLVNVFSPSLTNEFVVTFTNYNQPHTIAEPDKVFRGSLGYPYGTVFNNSAKQIPNFAGCWSCGFPTLSMPGMSGDSPVLLYSHKRMPSFADTVSKVFERHTVKLGLYVDSTGNEQSGWFQPQGSLNFSNGGATVSSGNALADMLLGLASSYGEDKYVPISDLSYKTIAGFAQDSWKVTKRLTLELGIRFDHIQPWTDPNTGIQVFNMATYSNNPADLAKLTGLSWNAIDSSIPKSGSPTRWAFVSPRFGMAWDIFGTGKTVIRGGWGMFHYNNEFNAYGSAVNIAQGNRNFSYGVTTLNGISNLTVGPAGVSRSSMNAVSATDDMAPTTKSYSLTVSQRLPWSSLFEISYVGNESTNLLWRDKLQDLNKVPLGALFAAPDLASAQVNNYRPFVNYTNMYIASHGAYQNYNSLQMSWARQKGRVNYMFNYTWGKAMGIRGGGNENSSGNLVDQFNPAANYGVLGYDRTQIFNATYSIELPNPIRGNRVLKGLVNGWQISGITQVQSGIDLQAGGSANFNLSGFMPDGVTSISARQILGTEDGTAMPFITCDPRKGLASDQYLNPSCFAEPTRGHNGNTIFPSIRGPAFVNSDLSTFKNFRIREQKTLQFRFSAFNFLNHPLKSFSSSGESGLNLTYNAQGQMTNKLFGTPSTKYGRRLIQLGVKFEF